MRDFIVALILSALLIGCTTLTRIKYETPEKQFELEHSRGDFVGDEETGHVPAPEIIEHFELFEEL